MRKYSFSVPKTPVTFPSSSPSTAVWELKLYIWTTSPAFLLLLFFVYKYCIQIKFFFSLSRQTQHENLYFTDSHLWLSLAQWLPFCAPVACSLHLWPVLQGTDYPQPPLKSMEAEHTTHDAGGPQLLTGAGTYRLATYWKHHRSSHLLILKWPFFFKKKKKSLITDASSACCI